MTGCNVYVEQANGNENAVSVWEATVAGGVEVECAGGTLEETCPNVALDASQVVVGCDGAVACEVWEARLVLQ